MTLTRTQTIDLLTVITAYDRRTIGEGDVAAWSEAALRAHWTYDEALNAVHHHFANSTKWLMPGHITEHIRTHRRPEQRTLDDHLNHNKQPATDASRARFMSQIRDLANKKTIQ